MAKSFRCSIVTLSASILDDDVTYASVPAWDGQFGLLPGHSPFLARLGIGRLRLDFPEGGSRWFYIDGGFAQVQDGHLVLLTENAIPAESLSLRDAEAELAEANARVLQSGLDQEKVMLDQQRARTKCDLARGMAERGGAI